MQCFQVTESQGIYSTDVFNTTIDTDRITADLFNGEEMSNINIQQSVNRANIAKVVLENSEDFEVNITSLRVEYRMCRKSKRFFSVNALQKEKWQICSIIELWLATFRCFRSKASYSAKDSTRHAKNSTFKH